MDKHEVSLFSETYCTYVDKLQLRCLHARYVDMARTTAMRAIPVSQNVNTTTRINLMNVRKATSHSANCIFRDENAQDDPTA